MRTRNRAQRTPNLNPAAVFEETTHAYVANVNSKVDERELETALEKCGELKYFDLVRSMRCAFVEFADPAGYAAAVAANPHKIGTEKIYVKKCLSRPNHSKAKIRHSRLGSRQTEYNTTPECSTTEATMEDDVLDTHSVASSLSLDVKGCLEARERYARAERCMERIEANIAQWQADVEKEKQRRIELQAIRRQEEAEKNERKA